MYKLSLPLEEVQTMVFEGKQQQQQQQCDMFNNSSIKGISWKTHQLRQFLAVFTHIMY